MRRAIGAEEESRITSVERCQQRAPIRFGLEQWQAVQVRSQAAGEQCIAVVQQMLRRDGRGDAGARAAHELDRRACRGVLEHDAQGVPACHERCQYALDEACLAIEHVHLRVSHLAVNQQRQVERRHGSQCRLQARDVGDPGIRVRGGAGRIELAADDRAAGMGTFNLGGAGVIRQI